MGPAMPVGVALRHQLQVHLMDESSRLQRVVAALNTHALLGYTVQFFINQRNELRGGFVIAVGHLFEQTSHVQGLGIQSGPPKSGTTAREYLQNVNPKRRSR